MPQPLLNDTLRYAAGRSPRAKEMAQAVQAPASEIVIAVFCQESRRQGHDHEVDQGSADVVGIKLSAHGAGDHEVASSFTF